MHADFLDCLCCPATGDPLELVAEEKSPNGLVVTGALRAPSGARYPIVRGIPRFVGEEGYASSFGYEWNRWPRVQFESENDGRPMAGHTTRMWETITGWRDEQIRGKTLVEFGCGPGRFLDVVRRKGGRAVGIDLSLATEAARRNFADDPDVLIVQGDILRPPFRAAAFDAGFSIGVLHHTPAPALGVQQLARCVRAGGGVAVCVYPKGGFYDLPSVSRVRRFHNRLPRWLAARAALGYAVFSGHLLSPVCDAARRVRGLGRLVRCLERNWLVTLSLPDVRWRVLDIFDAITPAIASTHTADEVRGWLEAAGCADIRQTPWCPTSAAGIRAH